MKRETKAILRNARLSPRRTRLIVDMIRGMKADQALLQLAFSEKRVSGPLYKLLKSAVANAVHNYGIAPESLVVSGGFVDGGPTTHRWMPKAFGSAGKIRKRTSHVTLVVSGESSETASSVVDSTEEKPKSAVAKKKSPRAVKAKKQAND